MKKALIAVFVLAAVMLAGCIAAQKSFQEDYLQLQKAYSAYGITSNDIAPTDLKQLENFKQELEGLKQRLSNEAARMLADIRADLAEAKKSLLLGQQKLIESRYEQPSCSKQSAFGQGLDYLKAAKIRAGLASQKIESFAGKFPEEASAVQEEIENLKAAAEGMENMLEPQIKELEGFC